MKKIRLKFTDMWGYEQYQFNSHDNYFTDLLSLKYIVEIVDDNPDLLIYSVFGNDFKKYNNCKKIFFTGENFSKDTHNEHFQQSDITLSHYDDSEKDILFPLWVIFINWFNKPQPRPLPSNPTYLVSLDAIQNNRERFLIPRKFCAFINNSPVQDRLSLFDHLSTYKQVDSYGKLRNNVGKALRGSEKDKIDVLLNYKFTIAFENSYHSGYNTEKIIQPFEAGCIPIYKGGERVLRYFNKNAFIYANEYKDSNKFIDYIISLDNDDRLWREMIMEKPLLMDNILDDFAPENILERIQRIL